MTESHSLWCEVVDDLLAVHTLAPHHLVVISPTLGTCVAGVPQEVEVAAVTGSIRALGGQVYVTFINLYRVTSQADHTHTTFGAGTGGAKVG